MKLCDFCNCRCCREKLITINIFDALRIKKNTGKKIHEFAGLVAPRILNIDENSLLFCRENGERFAVEYVLALKSRPCIFLDWNSKSCGIYDFAPTACRIYPFTEGRKIVSNPSCPWIPKFLFGIRGVNPDLIVQSKRENAEYKTAVKKWNRLQGTKKQCMSFLEKEAKDKKSDY